MPALKLGLIGDNIAASRAPELHRAAGALCGLDVRYDRLVPAERGLDFEALLAWARAEGYDGLNITYPYKERAARLVETGGAVARLGAVNTVVFGSGSPRGHNTDFTGFGAAYRAARDGQPGAVALLGCGGVGRAIGFALCELGAAGIRCFDTDKGRARELAGALVAAGGHAVPVDTTAEAARGAGGLVNATPLGMEGRPGTPLPRAAMGAPAWAFDAVYTPPVTRFLADAREAGARAVSGLELFFWQGVHCWEIFSGRAVDPGALRAALRLPPA